MSRRKRYDEHLDGDEWLLEILTDRAFKPRSGEMEIRRGGGGLVLWGEIDSDVTVNQLAMRRCSLCGRPARNAIYDLQSHQRTVLCESCRPRDGERS